MLEAASFKPAGDPLMFVGGYRSLTFGAAAALAVRQSGAVLEAVGRYVLVATLLVVGSLRSLALRTAAAAVAVPRNGAMLDHRDDLRGTVPLVVGSLRRLALRTTAAVPIPRSRTMRRRAEVRRR